MLRTESNQVIEPFRVFIYNYNEYIVDKDEQVYFKGRDSGKVWWIPVKDNKVFHRLDWVRLTDRYCDPSKLMIKFQREYIKPLNIFKVGSTLFVYDTNRNFYFFDEGLNGWRPTREEPVGNVSTTNDYCNPELNDQINKFFPICNGKYYLAPYQIFYDADGAKYYIDEDGNYYNDVSVNADGKTWSPCNSDKPGDNEIDIITDKYV